MKLSFFLICRGSHVEMVVCLGKEIEDEVEFSSTVVVIMSAVPINLGALLADVESLKDA